MNSTLADRVRECTARIVIIGQGYVGLPLAVEFGRAGFTVLGLDNDPARVARLNAGRSYIPDVRSDVLASLVGEGATLRNGRIPRAGTADVVIIASLRPPESKDLTFRLFGQPPNMAWPHASGQLVVLESTDVSGDDRGAVVAALRVERSRGGKTFTSPSRPSASIGQPDVHRVDIPKVVGGVTKACTEIAASLYAHIVPKVLQVSSATHGGLGEAVREHLPEREYALANEFALMSHDSGSTRRRSSTRLPRSPRIHGVYPGPGIGGHCPGGPPLSAWQRCDERLRATHDPRGR